MKFESAWFVNSINSHGLLAVNKRLDDWVTENCLDTRKVQYPRKDGTTTGQNTGISTPKRLGSSPRTDVDELLNGTSIMTAALQKKSSRKRKVCSRSHYHLVAFVCEYFEIITIFVYIEYDINNIRSINANNTHH